MDNHMQRIHGMYQRLRRRKTVILNETLGTMIPTVVIGVVSNIAVSNLTESAFNTKLWKLASKRQKASGLPVHLS